MSKKDDWGDEKTTDYEPKKEISDAITNSLQAKPFQTIGHLHRNTGNAIDALEIELRLLEMAGAVKEETVGSTTAYFLAENPPQGKLYFGGGGQLVDNRFIDEKPTNKTMAQPKKEIDLAELEELAASGKTQSIIAGKLHMAAFTLSKKMKRRPKPSRRF